MFNNCVKSESLGECVRWFGKEKGRGAGGCFICIICSSGLQKVSSQSSESHCVKPKLACVGIIFFQKDLVASDDYNDSCQNVHLLEPLLAKSFHSSHR